MKAYRAFFTIKRNNPFTCPVLTNLRLYQACVLSVVTYASQGWSPDINPIRRIEQIQKKALKWIIGRHGTTYKEIFIKLRVIPVVYFFIHYDLCFLNRLMKGMYDLDPFKMFCLPLPTRFVLRSENKVKLVYPTSYCKSHQ